MMICSRCLYRSSALRSQIIPSLPSILCRTLTTSPSRHEPATATSTSAAQPFSTPLSPSPNEILLGAHLKPKLKNAFLPTSSCVTGTTLKGLNYLKGRDDPVALAEEEYPEWLWKCLEAGVKEGEGEQGEGDAFSKSKKIRRKVAKQQRKLEAARLASGDLSSLQPKIPLTQQSIDLPANEEANFAGAVEADARREELRGAMRRERRAKIKEANFLKGM